MREAGPFIMLFVLFALAQAAPLLIIEFNKAGLATPQFHLGSEPLGKLTQEGRAAKERQGKIMRDMFGEYVPAEYNSSQFAFRTFKDELYVDSATAYIKGLLPDHKFKISNVRTERREADPVLSPRSFCPRIDWLAERDQKNSTRYTNLLDSLQPFEAVLHNLTNSSGFEAAASLGEAVNSLLQRNLSTPDVPKDLLRLAHRAYTMQHSYLPYGSDEAVKLGAFSMLDEVLQLIIGAATNRTHVKVAVFTTEDATFSALLKVLEMQNYIPASDAHLIITVEDSYYMRFFYNEQEREFRACTRPCVIQHFYQAMEAVTYKSKDDWMAACSVVGDEAEWDTGYLIIAVAVILAVAVCLYCSLFEVKPIQDQAEPEADPSSKDSEDDQRAAEASKDGKEKTD